MELRHLRYFLAVADELHFTRAAGVLHVAQPALSAQIRKLETEIGARLFDRTNRRVSLTPAGEVFRLRARAALEAAHGAAAAARKAAAGLAGTLRVGFVSSALFGVLPKLLSGMRRAAPEARIEVEELEPAEQLGRLRSGELDFGLMHAAMPQPEWETRLVRRERIVAVLPKGHPALRERKVTLRSVAAERVFLPRRHEFSSFHDRILEACLRAGFVPEEIHATRQLLTAVHLVAAGQGVALTPESFRALKVPGVEYRPLRSPAPEVELIGVWRRGDRAPLLERWLKELAAMLESGRSQRSVYRSGRSFSNSTASPGRTSF